MSAERPAWPLACPGCRTPLGPLPDGGGAAIACPACGRSIARRGRLWDALGATPMPDGKAACIARFVEEYTTVRHAEGRGDDPPEHFRSLPRVAPDRPLAWQWRIRARSYARLADRVLPALARDLGRSRLDVLDLGAGNGWLSHRLARAGHAPLAVDLSDDARDGLGAARHFDEGERERFPRMRADFDHLPLAGGCADAVVYNAAFHYSARPADTLAEALRVLAPGGAIVIMDSPIYRERASGERMVADRRAAFRARHGFASDALGSVEFLTDADVARLGVAMDLRWRRETPWYGLRWALRPLVYRVRRRRAPARFALLVGRRAP